MGETTQVRPTKAKRTQLGVLTLVAVLAVVLLAFNLLRMLRAGDWLSVTHWLFFVLVAYAAAAVLAITTMVTGETAPARVAYRLTLLGFAVHALAWVWRYYQAGQPPFVSFFEIMMTFALAVVLLLLLSGRWLAFDTAAPFALPIAALAVLLTQLFPHQARPLVPALQSIWLYIHVSVAMLGYGACALAFALAILYLFKDGLRSSTLSAWTTGLGAFVYASLSGFSVLRGVYRLPAWDFSTGSRVRLDENILLQAEIPYLGWVFLATALLLFLCFLLYIYGENTRRWAEQVFPFTLAAQMVSLAALIYAIKAGTYFAPQIAQRVTVSFHSAPLELTGLVVILGLSGMAMAFRAKQAAIVARLPALDQLDAAIYYIVAVAVIFLTLLLITGAVWANVAWGRYWGWDPKEVAALITWAIYAAYLHMRLVAGWRGRKAVYFVLVGFLAVVFTFVGVSFLLTGLHAYVD